MGAIIRSAWARRGLLSVFLFSGSLFAANIPIQLNTVTLKDAREILRVHYNFEEQDGGVWGVRLNIEYFKNTKRNPAVVVTKTKRPYRSIQELVLPVQGRFELNAEDKIQYIQEKIEKRVIVGDCNLRGYFSSLCPKDEKTQLTFTQKKMENGILKLQFQISE